MTESNKTLKTIQESLFSQFKKIEGKGVLLDVYKDDPNNFIYIEPDSMVSFSVLNPFFAVLIIRGAPSLPYVSLPTMAEANLYYSMRIPMGWTINFGDENPVYISSSDKESYLNISSRSFAEEIWLFCTARTIQENKDELATFMDQLTINSMLKGHTLSSCVMTNGEGPAAVLRLLNRYERTPFLSNVLVCGVDLV